MLRMVIKRMAIIKTGMMRIGPTTGVCSLLVQVGNVCAAAVLCAPAVTDSIKEGALQEVDQQMTLNYSICVDINGFSYDPVGLYYSLPSFRLPL